MGSSGTLKIRFVVQTLWLGPHSDLYKTTKKVCRWNWAHLIAIFSETTFEEKFTHTPHSHAHLNIKKWTDQKRQVIAPPEKSSRKGAIHTSCKPTAGSLPDQGETQLRVREMSMNSRRLQKPNGPLNSPRRSSTRGQSCRHLATHWSDDSPLGLPKRKWITQRGQNFKILKTHNTPRVAKCTRNIKVPDGNQSHVLLIQRLRPAWLPSSLEKDSFTLTRAYVYKRIIYQNT